ncbi:MAG: hypothetical protein Q9214_006762, partial [Letrouitia sp. 1 TL-2023]
LYDNAWIFNGSFPGFLPAERDCGRNLIQYYKLEPLAIQDDAAKCVGNFVDILKVATLSMHRLVQQSALRALSDADLVNSFGIALRLLYNIYPRQSPLGEPIPDWPTCSKYTNHVRALHEAFQLRSHLLTPVDPKRFSELLCDCGVFLWAQGQYTQSEELAKTSIQMAIHSMTEYDPLRAQPYTLLGCIYIRIEGRINEALDCLEVALQIRLRHREIAYRDSTLPMEDDIQLSNSFSNVAVVKKQMGDLTAAASLHEKALSIKLKYSVGKIPFLIALSYDNVGRVREQQGDLQEALDYFSQGYKLLSNHPIEVHTQHRMAQFTGSLGRVLAKLGETEQAQERFWEALRLYEKSVGVFHTDAALAAYHLGSLLMKSSQLEDARLLFEQAKSVFSRPLQPSPAKLAAVEHRLYMLYQLKGDVKLANEARSSSLQLWYKITGYDLPEGTLDDMALNFEALNRTD